MKRLICCAVLTFAFAGATFAQARLDPKLMKNFGGTYMVDCRNNASPKATVFDDSLVFLHGDKRVAGSKVQLQSSFYGNSPPPNFMMALSGQAPGGEMYFLVYQDKAGPYLTVDGDQKVTSAIGKPLTQQKFRRCDGSVKPMKTAAAPAAAAPAATAAAPAKGGGNAQKTFKGYALTEISAAGLLYNAKAKEIYYKALGPLVKEPWLAKLDGPSSEGQAMKVANADYVMLYTCKNHDCYDNNVVLLWSGVQDVVYGKVYQRGKSTLIGNPAPAVAAELEKLWKKQFRSQPK
jgi:hypothetical protein